jgi:hypothetical protein
MTRGRIIIGGGSSATFGDEMVLTVVVFAESLCTIDDDTGMSTVVVVVVVVAVVPLGGRNLCTRGGRGRCLFGCVRSVGIANGCSVNVPSDADVDPIEIIPSGDNDDADSVLQTASNDDDVASSHI